jgi:hypothetical protein
LHDPLQKVFNQGWMRFAKAILVAMLGFAFAAYAFDCAPIMSPDQAMECCDSMNCSHGMRGEDCCQAGTSIHAPIVQTAADIHRVAFAPAAFAIQPAPIPDSSIDHAEERAALRFHDPPWIFDPAARLQLRI